MTHPTLHSNNYTVSYTYNTVFTSKMLRRDLNMKLQVDLIRDHRVQSRTASDWTAYETTRSATANHRIFLRCLLNESERQARANKVYMNSLAPKPEASSRCGKKKGLPPVLAKKRLRYRLALYSATCDEMLHENEDYYVRCLSFLAQQDLFCHRQLQSTPLSGSHKQ